MTGHVHIPGAWDIDKRETKKCSPLQRKQHIDSGGHYENVHRHPQPRKGNIPNEKLNPDQFSDMVNAYTKGAEGLGVKVIHAHVNLGEGKAYCVSQAENEETVRLAHEKFDFPYDSISEVATVTPDKP